MTTVDITADALVVLRADKALSERFRFRDSTAAWFITEQGQKMAQMAQTVDPAYVDFNLTRYHCIQRELVMAFNRFDQILVLGSGFDTRALRLAQSNGGPKVFEVDLPEVIDCKRSMLKIHDFNIPDQVKLLGADLSDASLKQELMSLGFNPAKPTFVMLEGVSFFLPQSVTNVIFNPDHIGLARGSRFLFDYWTAQRVEHMNEKVAEKLGRGLFVSMAHSQNKSQLIEQFKKYGYNLGINSLEYLAKSKFDSDVSDPVQNSWYLIDAQL